MWATRVGSGASTRSWPGSVAPYIYTYLQISTHIYKYLCTNIYKYQHKNLHIHLVHRWRGSVYKLVYKELLAYISCYFVINMTYRMIIVPKSECNLAYDGETCVRWKTHRELFEQVNLTGAKKVEFDTKIISS